jgi:hypothetical protein
MLLVVFTSALAAAQSSPSIPDTTTASETWKSAATSAAADAAGTIPTTPDAGSKFNPARTRTLTAYPSIPAPVASPSNMVMTPIDTDGDTSADDPPAPAAVPAPIAEADASTAARNPLASSAAPSAASSPSNMVASPADIDAPAPGTAEIPASVSTDATQQEHSPNPIGSQPVADSQSSADAQQANDVARYEEEQSGIPPGQLGNGQQGFGNDGELTTPFGMQLREARRSLKSGEEADGLLITEVTKDGPAAQVGLRPYSHRVHDALAGAAMVGSLVPFGQAAILLIPMLDYMQVGETYDMIIGVDGSRVTNFLDFQDHMKDLQPGEVVYLSVLRDGKRIQVTMPVTAATVQASTN